MKPLPPVISLGRFHCSPAVKQVNWMTSWNPFQLQRPLILDTQQVFLLLCLYSELHGSDLGWALITPSLDFLNCKTQVVIMGDKSKCPGSGRTRCCQISAKRANAFEMVDNGAWLSFYRQAQRREVGWVFSRVSEECFPPGVIHFGILLSVLWIRGTSFSRKELWSSLYSFSPTPWNAF